MENAKSLPTIQFNTCIYNCSGITSIRSTPTCLIRLDLIGIWNFEFTTRCFPVSFRIGSMWRAARSTCERSKNNARCNKIWPRGSWPPLLWPFVSWFLLSSTNRTGDPESVWHGIHIRNFCFIPNIYVNVCTWRSWTVNNLRYRNFSTNPVNLYWN